MADVKTIFIVDDSRVTRLMMAKLIKGFHPDYNILEAGSGDEALEKISEFTDGIHLITIDVNMPGMDGITLAEKLKDLRTDSRIVLISANIQEPVRARVEDLGLRFVPKPIDESKIKSLMDDIS